MSKRLAFLALFATLAGCGGDSFKPNKIISDVEPNFAVSGRTKTVEIHGDFTKWKESNIDIGDISFGEGVTVDAVTVANEGFLVVTITAAPNATIGPRDIEVDGEDLVGAFSVKPPFEVLSSTIVQGDFALLDIVGYDTDWLEGRTHVTSPDVDVLTEGDDIFGIGSTTVISANFIQALIQIDPFAAAGPRGLSINGITTDDTRPDVLTVEAATFAPLMAGNNPLAFENAGYTSEKRLIPAGTALSVQDFAINAGTGDPIAIVFDEDLGIAEVIAFFGDESVFFADQTYSKFNFTAGKDLTMLIWDANWIEDAFFGDIVTSGDALTADLQYSAETAEAIGAGLQGETLAANGDERWFHFLATDRWSLVTTTMMTPAGTSTIDGVVRAIRESPLGLPSLEKADASGNGGDETLVTLAGEGLDVLIGVRDYFDNKSGMITEFDLTAGESAIPGTFYETATANVMIPEEGQVAATLTVAASNITVLTAIHVALDIDHSYRSDLTIELESPDGTIVTLFDGSGGSDDGIVEVFPDTTTEFGDLFDFTLDAQWDGTWTLHIVDGFPPDAGVVRSWGISLEGT